MIANELLKKLINLEEKNDSVKYALAVLRGEKQIKREIVILMPEIDSPGYRVGEDGVYKILKDSESSYSVHTLNGLIIGVFEPKIIVYDDVTAEEESQKMVDALMETLL
jgi:hypothetical protein